MVYAYVFCIHDISKKYVCVVIHVYVTGDCDDLALLFRRDGPARQ